MSTYGMRESAGAVEGIMGALTRNPEGLLLLAAGAALLLRSGRSQSRRAYADLSEYRHGNLDNAEESKGISERLGQAARRAGEYVSDASNKVSETTRSYASSAAEYAEEAGRIATEQSSRVANQARETADYVVREQPWAVALTGLMAGAAVAAVFAPTRIEQRTLGEVGQRLRSAAEVMGSRVMEAGMQAGERLSEVAEERGLTKEGLKEAARDVSETFGSALAAEESSPTGKNDPAARGQGNRGSVSTPSGRSNRVTPSSGGRT